MHLYYVLSRKLERVREKVTCWGIGNVGTEQRKPERRERKQRRGKNHSEIYYTSIAGLKFIFATHDGDKIHQS